jgi:phenylacetate-CoA ligase
MDAMSFLSRRVIHPLWALKEGSSHLKYLREYEKTQFLSLSELRELQWSRLKALLEHAYLNVPFYRKRFEEARIHPEDIKNFKEFENIPVLTKEDIQNCKEEMVAQNVDKKDLIPNMTGGSTGKPLHFYVDKKRMEMRKASTIRHNRWVGWDLGDKFAAFWGSRSDLDIFQGIKARARDFLLGRYMILDTSSLTEEKMMAFARKLKKEKPKFYLAYANSMYLFAEFVKENKIDGLHPVAIVTSAEVLHEHERALIEEVFACRIFNRYGCRETSVIASECKKHNGMHINAESIYLEIEKSSLGKYGKDEGEIIITDLLNYGMPLIRYKIEDVGSVSEEPCFCGRGLPLLKSLIGRSTEFILTPEGKYVSGAALTIFLVAKTPGLLQAQFIQESKDKTVMKVVKGPDFNEESMNLLNQRVKEFLGPQMKIHFEPVQEIPRESSGKFRFSISNIRESHAK